MQISDETIENEYAIIDTLHTKTNSIIFEVITKNDWLKHIGFFKSRNAAELHIQKLGGKLC